jgi:branched-chain amino acid transport system permease protein
MIIAVALRRLDSHPRMIRYVLLALGLLVALGLPWVIYPPLALNMAVWALFAMSVDLLLGYTGLLSFGHAAFWGTSAYVTGLVAQHTGLPFVFDVLAGALAAGLLAVPIGWLSVRRSGIYFAMVTLAFAQMVYFVANQWREVTGGENGLQGIERTLGGLDISEPFWFYYAALPLVLAGMWGCWRIVHSPFGRVLVAIRDNPSRTQAMGYDVARSKLLVFVLSAALAGLAGGLFAMANGFAALNQVYWTTSGQAVVITVLGGMGTLWGAVVGAMIVLDLEDVLATAGIDATGIVTGSIFALVVLLLRRGIWGSAAQLLSTRRQSERGRRADPAVQDEPARSLDPLS